MKQKLVIIGSLIITIAAINSCSNAKYDKLYPTPQGTVVTCDTTNVSFANDIVPILQNNCYSPGNGCHDAVGKGTSGYDFTTYNGIMPISQSGLMLADLNWESGHNDMPKNAASKLPQCDINKFTRWINQGSLNN